MGGLETHKGKPTVHKKKSKTCQRRLEKQKEKPNVHKKELGKCEGGPKNLHK